MDDELKGLLVKLIDKVDSLDGKVDAMQAGQEALRADVTELRTGQERTDGRLTRVEGAVAGLRTDVAVLQSCVDEVRHVTSANHFRVMGKIELLSDQLTKHIGEHGHDPARKAL